MVAPVRMDRAGGSVGKQKKNGKRLHLIPLIVGIYGALLGLGLVSAGLMEITNGVGLIRLVLDWA